MTRIRTLAAALALVACTGARAHEFWLAPGAYHAEPGSLLRIELKHGERFRGDTVIRNDEVIESFELVGPGGAAPVVGRSGSAANYTRPADAGLHIIGYRSLRMPHELSAGSFESYLREEGLTHIADRRIALGEVDVPGREVYSRCAKTLVSVGTDHGTGHDHRLGQPLELVPARHPDALGAGDKLPIRVLYQGRPLGGVSVVAVRRDDPDTLMALRTDDDGRVVFTVEATGVWMFTTIHMVRAPEDVDADWESFWSSLTMAIGGRSQ